MSERKPNGYWESLENMLNEVKTVMKKEGWTTLPSQKLLNKRGYASISHAIFDYHGGFHNFRTLLGEEQKCVKSGTWQDLNYTLEQTRVAIKKEGWATLPNSSILNKEGYSRLSRAIITYHGGFHKFRTLLGEEPKYTTRGSWVRLDYVLEQARMVMEKENWDTFPNGDVLAEKGYSGLGFAITKYHGGFQRFRELLGEEQKQAVQGTWKNLDYTLHYVKEIMRKENWDALPSQDILREKGYSSLGFAICKYHGGFHKFRDLLGEEQIRVKKGSWEDFNYTISQARAMMEKEDWKTLPSAAKLNEKGYASLGFAINSYHGGFPAFRELLAKTEGRPSEKEQLEGLLKRYVRGE